MCHRGWGSTLKMEFPHLRFSTLTTGRIGALGLDAAAYCYIRSVVFTSVCRLQLGALQKRMNRSRCRLACALEWDQGTIYRVGPKSPTERSNFYSGDIFRGPL